MIEIPYRSGRQRPCLIKRQTEEIQKNVMLLAEDHTYDDIARWLSTKKITATRCQVRYFVRLHTTKPRRYTIEPKKTYKEKMNTYIDELLRYKGDTYTIHVLHMRGSSWTTVTAKLHDAGLIHPLRHYTPIQWRIMGTKEDIREWRDTEIERLAHPSMG